jgi:hypothetical protein
MKKLVIIIAIVVAPIYMSAQDAFDSFEFEREVSSVVVTKNMFKLLSKLDLESNDIEAKEYLELVNNLDNIKIYSTENKEVGGRMDVAVATYLSQSPGLSELMRVKDSGKDRKSVV